MKKSPSWRLLILVAGMLLGLLAGLGLSAPAVAAPVHTVATTDHYDDRDKDKDKEELKLRVDRDGKLKVIGKDYDAYKVRVIIIQTNHKDKDKKIYDDKVRTDDGYFKVESKKAKCGNEYRAYSYSDKDGWDKSNKVRVECRKDGHYGHYSA